MSAEPPPSKSIFIFSYYVPHDSLDCNFFRNDMLFENVLFKQTMEAHERFSLHSHDIAVNMKYSLHTHQAYTMYRLRSLQYAHRLRNVCFVI